MKRFLWTAVLSTAILALSGCGGGGTKEVVKDASYYKEEFKKATTIKALNTEQDVLFTMKSLGDSFISSFDVNGTNEGINRDIIALFKSNFADKINNVSNVILKDDVAIILPGILDENKTQIRLDSELKSAIKTVCNDCKEDATENWFTDNQTTLEKSAEDNSGIDDTDDNQPLYAKPPPEPFLIIGQPPRSVIENYDIANPVEIQTLRAEYDKGVDKIMP